VRDPELLVGPYLTREAVASSRIEGTQASLSDVLQAEASGTASTNEDVAEVERYIAATRQGYTLVKTLPLRSASSCSCTRRSFAVSAGRRSCQVNFAGHRSGWGRRLTARIPRSTSRPCRANCLTC
jgi:hypothetical protein